MTFDEQLKRAFDTLSDRLRDEMSRQVQAVVDELAGTARAERDRAAGEARERALDEARERAVEIRRRQLEDTDRTIAEIRRTAEEDRARAVDEVLRAADARLEQREAEFRRQVEAEHAERDAAQARSAHALLLERLADNVRAIDRSRTLSEVLDTLSSAAARDVARAAVFVAHADGFRSWRLIGFGDALDGGDRVEQTREHAGIMADAQRSGSLVSSGAAPAFADLPPDRDRAAIPLTIGERAVAVLYVDQPSSTSSQASIPLHALEILCRHGSRALESITAFKAARVVAARSADAASEVAPSADEGAGDEGAAARRYARLLVSEIRLYHEPEVVAGRRDRDLASRLGGEIARARVLYEQRVPPHVRERSGYFEDELVRTLANGDATLLQLT